MALPKLPAHAQAGSYTPVASSLTNVDSIATLTGMYSVVGNLVSVVVDINDIEFTSTGVFDFEMTLPLAPGRNFAAAADVIGSGAVLVTATVPSALHVTAVVASTRVQLAGSITIDAANNTGSVQFSYLLE